MPFLTDEEQQRSWDPFERAKQTESAEPAAGPEPTHSWDPFERAEQTEAAPDAGPAPVASWGNGAVGVPSGAFVDPDTAMSRLLHDQLAWQRYGIPPRPHIPEGRTGIVPPVD